MSKNEGRLRVPHRKLNWKRALLGAAGVILGGVLLWLALRGVDPAEISDALRRLDGRWLTLGVVIYLASIGMRCLRWGILLRATDDVKWRHATEALITGFAANYVLPGRIGELFRADYARRIFNMSRFTSLGTIVVERVCDGLVLVCALWCGFAWIFLYHFTLAETDWIVGAGAAASVLFGAALVFILLARRIDLRRIGIPEIITMRWDRLVTGVSSVMQGNARSVVSCSVGVWAFEVLALNCVVRSFGVTLSPAESFMLLGLSSLSTLMPTAPGYVGTYQLVFANVFKILGYPQTIGVVAATAFQLFCFGSVTILGGGILLARGSVAVWRAHKWISPAAW